MCIFHPCTFHIIRPVCADVIPDVTYRGTCTEPQSGDWNRGRESIIIIVFLYLVDIDANIYIQSQPCFRNDILLPTNQLVNEVYGQTEVHSGYTLGTLWAATSSIFYTTWN